MEKFVDEFDIFADLTIKMYRQSNPTAMERGTIHEVLCHRFLTRNLSDVTVLPMTEMKAERTGRDAENKLFKVPTNSDATGELIVRNRALQFFDKDYIPDTPDDTTYYIPRAKNLLTYDAFMTRRNKLYLFQMTVAKSYNVEEDGLKELKQRLPAKYRSWNLICVTGKAGSTAISVPVDLLKKYPLKLYNVVIDLPQGPVD